MVPKHATCGVREDVDVGRGNQVERVGGEWACAGMW